MGSWPIETTFVVREDDSDPPPTQPPLTFAT